jgi:hypothetical protein
MTYLPVIIDKWITSCNDIPSNTANTDTTNANVTVPRVITHLQVLGFAKRKQSLE